MNSPSSMNKIDNYNLAKQIQFLLNLEVLANRISSDLKTMPLFYSD